MSHEHVEPAQNWTICEDGRVEKGSVKRAVDEFAREHQLTVMVTYAEGAAPSWFMRRPIVNC